MARCCSCPVTPGEVCRQSITSADLATLLYVQGLDVNLCEKFQTVASLLQLRDCVGNIIAANAQVVLCADFAAQLCNALAALPAGAAAVPGVTELIGADCLKHILPLQVPLAVVDTPSVDLTINPAVPQVLQADVIISPTAGNTTVILPNGVYTPSICLQMAALVGPFTPVVFGVTPILGLDCQGHVVNETPFTFTDTTTIDGTVSGPFGHDLTAVVRVSALPGNDITIQADGLYAPGTNLQAIDTPCFDFTLVEFPPGSFQISGSPIISPNAGNSLSCVGNGLFVPAVGPADVSITTLDTACLNLDVVEGPPSVFQITGNPIISPDLGNALSCTANGLFVAPGAVQQPVTITPIDTPCFDAVVGGAFPNFTISGNPIISPNADNSLSCLPNGLFAPDVDIVGIDTASVDIEVIEGPNEDFSIQADVNISAAPGNTISIIGDGLYASGSSGTVLGLDTACIDVTVTEAPPDTFTVSAVPIISPDVGNTLVCSPNGLFVPPAVAAPCVITPLDTQCIDMVVTGACPAITISANPIVAPRYLGAAGGIPNGGAAACADGCNGITCTPTGLQVQPPDFANVQDVGSIVPQVGPGQPILTGESYPLQLFPVTVFNGPQVCRDTIVAIYTRIPELQVSSPGNVVIHIRLFHDISFPGAVPPVNTGGPVIKTEWWLNANAGNSGTVASTIVNTFYLPCGQGGTITTTGVMDVELAQPGTIATVNGIVVRSIQSSA